LPISDVIGFVLFASFGLWLLLMPRSVARFYTWFHRGRYALPTLGGYRVIGAFWIVLMIVVAWITFVRPHVGR
jgi:hypothetical protein